MDSELFTVGGLAGLRDSTMHSRDVPDDKATLDQVHYQTARTLQTYRHLGKLLYWALVIYVINMLLTMIPKMIIVWNSSMKSNFSQKEGLQYLGASTNVVRDDTGWPSTDSLAEAAEVAQNTATNMLSTASAAAVPAAKATFVVPRERMTVKNALTPEEQLLKRQQGGH